MKFEDWWATLSPPERRVIGEHNARFVWNEAVEVCAKVCESRYMGDNNREDMEARRCADAIRSKGQ